MGMIKWDTRSLDYSSLSIPINTVVILVRATFGGARCPPSTVLFLFMLSSDWGNRLTGLEVAKRGVKQLPPRTPRNIRQSGCL